MITVSHDETTTLYLFVLVTGASDVWEAMEAASAAYGLEAVSAVTDSFYDGFSVKLERD